MRHYTAKTASFGSVSVYRRQERIDNYVDCERFRLEERGESIIYNKISVGLDTVVRACWRKRLES